MSYDLELLEKQSIETIREASDRFGDKLYALSSFGTDSTPLFKLLQNSGVKVEILAIDTGFWFDETHSFREDLERDFNFKTSMYGPHETEVTLIQKFELWETDPEDYAFRTKLDPLTLAISELEVDGLISGIRHDQTKTRAQKSVYEDGSDGEVRIHPMLEWTKGAIDAYYLAHNLRRHPLYSLGYGSVGDWPLTSPGEGREGRNLGARSECGLHLVGGQLVRATLEEMEAAA